MKMSKKPVVKQWHCPFNHYLGYIWDALEIPINDFPHPIPRKMGWCTKCNRVMEAYEDD
jgi:hypothetical protein